MTRARTHLLSLCCLNLLALSLAAEAVEPDLILHHGKIVTVDKQFSVQQAMAVTGQKIVAVGTNEEVLRMKGSRTELLDLSGRMVLPGFIDSHTHSIWAAVYEYDHAVPQMDTIPEVLEYIRSRTRALKEGDWIVVQQVFITRLRERRYPTRAELDQAAPKNPVVFRTGPDGAFNSLALQLCGVGNDYKIPTGIAGMIEINEQGELTGVLRNFAKYLQVPATGRQPGTEEKLQRVRQLFQDYNSVGITMVCDRAVQSKELEVYEALHNREALTVRVAASYYIDTLESLEKIQEKIRQVGRNPLFTRKDEILRIIGVKFYLDGGMLTGSAYLREPWGVSAMYGIRDPDYRGVLFIPPERLLPIVRTAVECGLQFTAHSVGDGAVQALLDAYEQVEKDLPLAKTRPCISHANFESEAAVQKMARLGVTADIQPAWIYLDTSTLASHFGYDRLRWFQPLKSLFQAGATVGGGSDHMQKIGSMRAINPYNPFLGIQTTITRTARGYSGALHPEEALTREQAIRFYTSNNAYILFADDKVGSLEPGKLADFIVIDTDLLACPAEKIKETQVLRTYLNGKAVYKK